MMPNMLCRAVARAKIRLCSYKHRSRTPRWTALCGQRQISSSDLGNGARGLNGPRRAPLCGGVWHQNTRKSRKACKAGFLSEGCPSLDDHSSDPLPLPAQLQPANPDLLERKEAPPLCREDTDRHAGCPIWRWLLVGACHAQPLVTSRAGGLNPHRFTSFTDRDPKGKLWTGQARIFLVALSSGLPRPGRGFLPPPEAPVFFPESGLSSPVGCAQQSGHPAFRARCAYAQGRYRVNGVLRTAAVLRT